MEIEKAKARALLLLKFRPRTEKELGDRLKRLGFGPETVGQVLADFKAKGLVDDERFARYFAQSRMGSRPTGRRTLVTELKAKGISPEAAALAAEAASEGKSELDVALELARKKAASFRGVEPAAAQRRLFGYLSRRGFPSDVVYKAVREAVGTGQGGGEVEIG